MTTPSKRSMERAEELTKTNCCCNVARALSKTDAICGVCETALAFDRLIDDCAEVAQNDARFPDNGFLIAQSIRLKLKGGEDAQT